MITIIANVGNAGYALPMVQAYPTNLELQQLLAWNPVEQALDYVPYVGNTLGDFGVTRDLSVGRNAAVAGTLAVTGNTTLSGALAVNGGITPTDGSLEINGSASVTTSLSVTNSVQVGTAGAGPLLVAGGMQMGAAVPVVGTRKTGWVAMTGTPVKATRATGTVTLVDLAGIVMALQADLLAHGLIGA